MKIGKISKEYNLSADTLRYYINYGLLVPPKKNTQYDFDEQTVKDLETILELKELSFSLKEIHKILSLTRISGLHNETDKAELRELYINKRNQGLEELEVQKNRINTLNEKISSLKTSSDINSYTKGVPLNMLPLLCCPNCGKALGLSKAETDSLYVFKASLQCECGYKAHIDDGILITENKATSFYDKPDLSRELYKDLPPSLISLFQRSYHQMIKHIEDIDLKGKVVMETYVNAYFFMHNHIEHLDPTAYYVVVDKYPETLRMYKRLMEDCGSNLNMLFIADSGLNLPIKKDSVDLNLDFFASNEHQFYKHTFLLNELAPFLKANSNYLGTYFYFSGGNKSIKNLNELYPESDINNFNRSYFFNSIKEGAIKLTDWQEIGSATDSGDNLGFGFHEKGEKLHLMVYFGTN